MHLKDSDVYATLPAADIERARVFYRDVLELEELRSMSDMPSALFRAGNDTRIFLYQREATKADHTVLSFHVKDIERVVAELAGKGVRFESYDEGPIRTENGVAALGGERAAWFKDSEGNILSLYEKTPSSRAPHGGKEVHS